MSRVIGVAHLRNELLTLRSRSLLGLACYVAKAYFTTWSVQLQDASMNGPALLKCRSQCPMQPVFEIELAAPGHHVGEQVTVEGGVLVQ